MEYNFKKSAKRSEWNIFILLTFIFTGLFAATPGYTQNESGSFEFDGYNREYQVYLPQPQFLETKMPLIIVLHGHPSTIELFKTETLLHEMADTIGFVVVYPQGVNLRWNIGPDSIDPSDNFPDTDDVGFLSALIDTMYAHFDVDLARVYCCGHSGGGAMSFRMAGECGQRFAAVASVSCPLFDTADSWQMIRPMPVLQMHGTEDPYIPYLTGFEGFWPIPDMIDFWLNTLQCGLQTDTIFFPDIVKEDTLKPPSGNSQVQKISWTDCAGDNEFVHYKIINSGHQWPGAAVIYRPGLGGNYNGDINASLEILNFFKKYQNPLVNLAYAKSVIFDFNNFISTTDTIHVTAKLTNPEQHPVNVYAFIEGEMTSYCDSIPLYDNGLNGDAEAFDNTYTLQQTLPELEKDFYRLDIKTNDLSEQITSKFHLHEMFTNIGPIVVADRPYTHTDRDRDCYLYLTIKNEDRYKSLERVTVNLSTEDDRVQYIEENDINYNNMEPGIDITGRFKFHYQLGYNSDSTKINPIVFDVNIFRDGIQYWFDSFKFSTDETIPDPPINLKAEFDNTTNTVTLSWSPCHATDLDRYNIYRGTTDNVDSSKYLNSVPCVDTSYTDCSTRGPVNYYWVTAVDFANNESEFGNGIPVSINDLSKSLPEHYFLNQNYPNPFNPSTTIEFSLPKSEYVELKVYDILGKEVSTLISKKLNRGKHTYSFDGKNLASGIYYYQLVAGAYRDVKKLILLK